MRSERFRRLAFVAALGVFVAACGGGDSADDHTGDDVALPGGCDKVSDLDETAAPRSDGSAVAPENADAIGSATAAAFDPAAAFYEEFNGAFLDVGWVWVGEDRDGWSIADGRLELTGGLAYVAGDPVNFLTRDLPADSEFLVQTRLRANPQEDLEAAGLALVGPDRTCVALALGHCETCLPENDGVGIFVEASRDGESLLAEPLWFPWDPDDEVVLSLEWIPEWDAVVGSYSLDRLVSPMYVAVELVDAPEFTAFGLFVDDRPNGGPDSVVMTGSFDWVRFRSYG